VRDGIIAVVKGWHAAILALPLWIAPPAGAAEDIQSAAKELGRKTSASLGREPVAVTWRNASSLGPESVAQARGAFEVALREAGARAANGAMIEAQITLSESASAYLLVEELKKGDERQVWIASWSRVGSRGGGPVAVLEKRLLWEQEEPILDVATLPDGLLVLTPAAVIRTPSRQTAPISTPRPWPRDVRGRLRLNGRGVQAHLPGVVCGGSIEPLAIQCRASDEPWTIESGRALLLASFAPNRNYFDGRVVTQGGVRKTVAPFYSAAAVDGLWVLAGLDGRAGIFDSGLDAIGSAGAWGSDLAASETRCGGGPVVLASRAGDGPDAVQAFAISNRAPATLGAALEFPGPVTALWPPGIAVVRNGNRHQAYAITVSCAQ
jgi:hypothetical protein